LDVVYNNRKSKDQKMSSLEKRRLKKAYARCPRCKRILKVRLRRIEEKRSAGLWAMQVRNGQEEWELEKVPPHKFYQPDPDRLSKLIKTGKVPEEHPMCSMYGVIRTKPTKYEPEYWEIVGWRE